MTKSPTFANLESLLDLNQPVGVDMRPTLLRVLTDLYLQRPTHPPEDERYYTELALRLIDATDLPERAALATRLASYPSAPHAVVERLARDVLEVAAPILKHSPCLTPDDLKAIAKHGGMTYAEIIATREPTAAPSDEPASSSMAAAAAIDEEASELAELFYAAGAPERRLILLNLEYALSDAPEPLATLRRTDIWRLESAALQHNLETVVRDFERTLGISRRQARRVINDDLGEPIVVAAKAMTLPADVLQRMLLFMNPRVGQSVDRVYDLSALFTEITVDAARRLVAILRDADPAEPTPVQHETTPWRTAADHARRALSEVSRRPEVQPHSRPRSLANER
jgi:hypothetical protein